MNSFEALCKLASDEEWCWKIFCTTCGHMHFRYAFAELAKGNTPSDSTWIISSKNPHFYHSLGQFPRSYTKQQTESLAEVCSNANLMQIAGYCKFPDWLAYLGLVLFYTNTDSEAFRTLSQKWAEQFLTMISEDPVARNRLSDIAQAKSMLDWRAMNICEMHMLFEFRGIHHWRNTWRQPPDLF